MTTHEQAMSDGLAKIAREYAEPPPGGALVPRAWVEAQLPEISGEAVQDLDRGLRSVAVLLQRQIDIMLAELKQPSPWRLWQERER